MFARDVDGKGIVDGAASEAKVSIVITAEGGIITQPLK